MCLAHWLHIWLRSQQLGFESRQFAKYGIVHKVKIPGMVYGTLGTKRVLKRNILFRFLYS